MHSPPAYWDRNSPGYRLEAVKLGLAVKGHGHHVVAGIRQRADQFTIFQQGHAHFVYAGLELFGGRLLVRKAEIYNQVFPVYAGPGGNVLALDAFIAYVGASLA